MKLVIEDLSGMRFARLVVVGMAPKTAAVNRGARWHAVCDCGNHTIVRADNLKRGKARSCGCLARELAAARLKTNAIATKHGMVGTPTYNSYVSMVRRCTSPTRVGYQDYGGRGITVCQAWIDSFDQFVRDMGLKPDAAMSIERIDNNGNYEPGNCVWATQIAQQNNRRTTRRITWRGKTLSLANWARECGVKAATLRGRIDRGMPLDIALGNAGLLELAGADPVSDDRPATP